MTPHEEGFTGTCQIQYGPIQIDPDLKKAVGLATAEGLLQVRCEGTNLGNGNQFDMIKVNQEEITFYDSRFDSTISREQIRKELVIEPSTNDPLRVKLRSGGSEYHTKTLNQDDRDKMILFLDFMIRKKENLNESFSSFQPRGQLKTQMSGGTIDSASNTYHEPNSSSSQNTKQTFFKSNSMYYEKSVAGVPVQTEQPDTAGRSFMFESHNRQADLGQSLLYEATPIQQYYMPPPPNTPPPPQPTVTRYQPPLPPQRNQYAELNASMAISDLTMNGKPIQIRDRPKHIPGVKDSNYYQVPQTSQNQSIDRTVPSMPPAKNEHQIDLEISGIRPHRIVESRNSVAGPSDYGFYDQQQKIGEPQQRISLYHAIPIQEGSNYTSYGGANVEHVPLYQSVVLNQPSERTITRVVEHKMVRLPPNSPPTAIQPQTRELHQIHLQKAVSDSGQYEIQRLKAEIGLLNLRLSEADKSRGQAFELQEENQRQRAALAKLKGDNGRTGLNR